MFGNSREPCGLRWQARPMPAADDRFRARGRLGRSPRCPGSRRARGRLPHFFRSTPGFCSSGSYSGPMTGCARPRDRGVAASPRGSGRPDSLPTPIRRPGAPALLLLVLGVATPASAILFYTFLPSNGAGMTAFAPPRVVDPAAVAVPPGFCVEPVVTGLTYPVAVFTD